MAGGDAGINFLCPRCRRQLKAEPNMAGAVAECPFCKKAITIPFVKPAIAVVTRRKGVVRRHLAWLAFLIIAIVGVTTATILCGDSVKNGILHATKSANPTKTFDGIVISAEDDGVLIVFDKGEFCERKVRLDKVKVHDNAKEFISRRCAVEVRVAYDELDGEYIKGIVWGKDSGIRKRDDAITTKSLNDILVDEGYATYDNQ